MAGTVIGIVIGAAIGALVGYALGHLLLRFFQDEIFNWMDRVVNRVRKFLGLKPS